jgi:hypothetical protein
MAKIQKRKLTLRASGLNAWRVFIPWKFKCSRTQMRTSSKTSLPIGYIIKTIAGVETWH